MNTLSPEEEQAGQGSAIGLEYQLLDDARHPDAARGREGNRTLASLYDLIPARDTHPRPTGQWNDARIVSHGPHVEDWLNGGKVLELRAGRRGIPRAGASLAARR